MKEHPVDQFFSDKLANIAIEPSAEVWRKIEHHLEYKHKPWGLFLSIAASFTIILAIFSYVLLKPNSSKPVHQEYFEQIQDQSEISNQIRPKSVQPSGTVPGSENSIPVMAQEDQKQTIAKHTSLNKKRVALADYVGDESEFSETTLFEIEDITLEKRKKKKYGISIANTDKYLKPQQAAEEDNYKEQLKGYTAAQWENITNRKKLESPPLPNVSLPKFKFEKSLKD
jgi:hypothetical protein